MANTSSDRITSILGWLLLGGIIWAGYQDVTLVMFFSAYFKTFGLFGSIFMDYVDKWFDTKSPGRSSTSGLVGNFAMRFALAMIATGIIVGLVNFSGANATIPGLASFGFAMMVGLGLLIAVTVCTVLVAHGTSDAFPMTGMFIIGAGMMFLNKDPAFYTLAFWFPPLVRDIVAWILGTVAKLFTGTEQAVLSAVQEIIH